MRRLLHILLSLLVVFNSDAQITGAAFHGAYHAPASAGGGGYCGDAEADAWIDVIEVTEGITITTAHKNKMCAWVAEMKSSGYWSKIHALHWNGWSDADGNKYNVVNPVNSDAAYRATYTGSPTHGSTGIVFNGTSQNGNIYIKPNAMSQNSITVIVSLTAQAGSEVYAIGSIGSGGTSPTWLGRQGSTNMYTSANAPSDQTIATARSAGVFGVSRTGSTTMKTFRDGAQIGSTYTSASVAPNNVSMFIGAASNNGSVLARQSCTLQMDMVGDGFTDAEMADFYSDFNTFRTGW